MSGRDDKQKRWQEMRHAAQASTVGFVLIVTIVVFTALGGYLDRVFDTAPVLTIVFFLLGAVGGLIKMVWDVMRISQDE